MDSLAQELRETWLSIGMRVSDGASDGEIDRFETAHGVRLPREVHTYFRAVNGMPEDDTDEDLLSFLPLRAVKPVPEALAEMVSKPHYRVIMETLSDAAHWFVFVDYMVSSHAYAIHLLEHETDVTPVLWICDSKQALIADSLADFLKAYLQDPRSILFPTIRRS
jgi:hypothetical protein